MGFTLGMQPWAASSGCELEVLLGRRLGLCAQGVRLGCELGP